MGKTLYIKGTDKLVLRLEDGQLDSLTDLLEEESTTDRDYYVDGNTIAYLEENGADKELVAALRKALGAGAGYRDQAIPGAPPPPEGIDVEWRED
jgi:hypothetical protein